MIASIAETDSADRMSRLGDARTACADCRAVLLETLNYCLAAGGRHVKPELIGAMSDAADICGAAADFLSRASPLRSHVLAACEVICGRCADECAGFADEPPMAACAEACRRCAEACAALTDHVPDEADYDAALEDTFPASDPIASFKCD